MADDTGAESGADGSGTTDADTLRATILQQVEAQGTPEADAGEPAGETPATYTLKDGTVVPLDELEGGYLRQSDYTRKTQELAAQRAEAEQALRLFSALSENPAETLAALQRQLLEDNGAEDLDPLEAQILQHEERFAQLEQERFNQELAGIVSTLESQYAERGFDRDTVLEWAVTHEIQNLEAAFFHWENSQASEQARKQRNQQALDRKTSIPPLGGRSRQMGGDVPEFREVKTVADAMANALAELEATS